MNELELKEELARIRKQHTEDLAQKTFNLLLMGRVGVGKTRLVTTARKPVLIHSFDPGGTTHLRKWKEDGSIIVDSRFEIDDREHPTAYDLWDTEFLELRQKGFFNNIGTYVIDGLTMLLNAAKNRLVEQRGPVKCEGGVIDPTGWQILQGTISDIIKLATNLPCDFIMMSHIIKGIDPANGLPVRSLAAPPKMQVLIPLLFGERWQLRISETSKGIDRYIHTQISEYDCSSTRMGEGVFNAKEPPDIKKLLEKAGYPTKDKAY